MSNVNNIIKFTLGQHNYNNPKFILTMLHSTKIDYLRVVIFIAKICFYYISFKYFNLKIPRSLLRGPSLC